MAGADVTMYIWFLGQIRKQNQTFSVAFAPVVTGSVFKQKFRLPLAQCTRTAHIPLYSTLITVQSIYHCTVHLSLYSTFITVEYIYHCTVHLSLYSTFITVQCIYHCTFITVHCMSSAFITVCTVQLSLYILYIYYCTVQLSLYSTFITVQYIYHCTVQLSLYCTVCLWKGNDLHKILSMEKI